MPRKKTACVVSEQVCPRVGVDVARLFGYLEANGFTIVDRVEKADLVLAAMCAVHQGAEDSGFELLRTVDARRRPGSRLIGLGCLPAICQERFTGSCDGSAVPPRSFDELDDLIGATVKIRDYPEVHDTTPLVGRARRTLERARQTGFGRLVQHGLDALHAVHLLPQDEPPRDHPPICRLRVAWGCSGECTYCAIRIAAGPLRSKPLDAILKEFDEALAEGFGRFEVIAGDVGAYGQDVGSSVVDLLEALFSRPGRWRLIIDDVNVSWIVKYRARIIPLLASEAGRIESILIPIQSGSDRILALMKRGHTSEEVVEALAELWKAAPGLAVLTHVLVGFPGETDDDVARTIRVLGTGPFERVDIYPYSDRPGTAARELPDKVPAQVIEARCSQMMSQLPRPLLADYGASARRERQEV